MLRGVRIGALAGLLMLASAWTASAQARDASRPLRAGIIGLDTSHVPAFTKTFNNPKATGDLADIKVVAGYPGGTDIPPSRDRVQKFTAQLRDEMGIEIVDSIPELLKRVDVILLESVDGRPHLEQARPVIEAGKPLFIDKPAAGSLADVIAIFELAKKHKVPCFSTSSLRFGVGVDMDKVGDVLGCTVWGPCSIQPPMPDLFFYGVHGVEMIYTVMGTGCETVVRTHTADTDVVTGKWKDGRIATYRGLRGGKSKPFGITVFGSKSVQQGGRAGGYDPMLKEIAAFFKTGKPPVDAEDTIEIFAFMEAAEESKRLGGKPVRIADVMARARAQAASSSR